MPATEYVDAQNPVEVLPAAVKQPETTLHFWLSIGGYMVMWVGCYIALWVLHLL
jgi:hypothetical protein